MGSLPRAWDFPRPPGLLTDQLDDFVLYVIEAKAPACALQDFKYRRILDCFLSSRYLDDY